MIAEKYSAGKQLYGIASIGTMVAIVAKYGSGGDIPQVMLVGLVTVGQVAAVTMEDAMLILHRV